MSIETLSLVILTVFLALIYICLVLATYLTEDVTPLTARQVASNQMTVALVLVALGAAMATDWIALLHDFSVYMGERS